MLASRFWAGLILITHHFLQLFADDIDLGAELDAVARGNIRHRVTNRLKFLKQFVTQRFLIFGIDERRAKHSPQSCPAKAKCRDGIGTVIS